MRRADIALKKAEIVKLNEQAAALETELNGLISNSEVISRNIEDLTLKLNTYSTQISDQRVKMVTAQSSITEIETRNAAIDEALKSKEPEKEKLEIEL